MANFTPKFNLKKPVGPELFDVETFNGNSDILDTALGALAATYIHTQMTPSDTWTIVHNLGKYPTVMVVDSSNSTVVGDIRYLSENSVELTFVGGFAGKAYLN